MTFWGRAWGLPPERLREMKTYKEKAKQFENQELARYLDSLDEEEREEGEIYNDDYDEIIEERREQ